MTSTSVSAGSVAQQLAALFVPGSRVCLTTHVNPDGDGLGSEVALAHLLQAQGLTVSICNPSPTPDRFAFLFTDLPGVDRSAKAVVELRRADVIVVLDISEISRLGGLAETVEARGVPVGCIDHHVGPGKLPDGPRLIDPTAAATGELIHRMATELDWPITTPVARALYVALVTDTGSFRFSNTTPTTLRTAAHLLECGANPEAVYRDVYASGPVGRPRLLAEVLQTLEYDADAGLTWLTVPSGALERHGVDADDLDGAVEHARAIGGVRMALLFREISAGRIKVSFRSVGSVDVAALARTFGGGGHTKAAGAAIAGTMDEVQAAVLAAARTWLATPTDA
ncbi:MAG: bifunctional oligoribonuclease/PAP phosphatase NrnA [Gemmatimonadota bacterium]